jgi:hypothetical protein
MSHSTPARIIALVLATVLLVVAATPAKAEALEPLTIVAIAGLVVAGVVLIAYLVIANIEGDKRAEAGEEPAVQIIWVAVPTPES